MSPYQKQHENNEQEKDLVQLNGFKQIIEMLQVADPAFRDSLLKRLAARDRDLAANICRDLGYGNRRRSSFSATV